MRKIGLIIAGALVCLGLGLAVVGCDFSSAGKDKMAGDKMSGDQMQGGKMAGDKMQGDKMAGDKMDKK